jgi:hypothetical protein
MIKVPQDTLVWARRLLGYAPPTHGTIRSPAEADLKALPGQAETPEGLKYTPPGTNAH